eukprot:CAMPEP_0181403590 /NCGR_PEP_ID=MMETSP1110-20121109/3791_1 /TAXON_ID=174948 /ORGANISM="Symbiodinium sp., Strain CCMP421" /LENGTH=92 /DNA_ID=CAMNT_0023525889 /DNA_START=103 /DNA_END=380 /DNA_ORIENTATION=-
MTLKRRESGAASRKGAAALHSRHEFYNDTWRRRLALKLQRSPIPAALQEERAQVCESTMATIAQEMEDILAAVDRTELSEDLVNHSNDASRW